MSRLIRRLSGSSLSSITTIGGSTNGAPLPGVVGSVGPMAIPAGADPQACFEVFCSHWAQIKGIIVKQNASGGRFPRTKASFDDIQAVANYATQMMYLLVEETQPTEGVMGHMLELTIEENVMDQLLSWGLQCGEHVEDMKRELLRIYEMMLAQAKQAVLMHNALLNPLLRLLIACSEYCSDRVELHLVLLLHQLCVSLSKDPMLLEYLFHASPSQGPAKFLLFSLLIPFLHRDGKVGQQARDALLLCISVSSQGSNIAKYIAESTNLCPVLATGLGALYSRLPRKLDIRVDHWHCLTREDWTVIPELCMFLHSLEFCNAVVQVAHPIVSNQLIQYFHDGFLVPVIGPALHQFSFADGDSGDVDNPNPQDEIVAATAYVNLFLTSITAPPLMKGFLHYLCMGQHEGQLVLESLLSRFSTNSRLCLVTLSLFDTLVNLNCEDFMLELILRYLVPCNHLMVSQRKAIRQVDLHSKSADRFLSLRPTCCKTKPTKEEPKKPVTVPAASDANRMSNGNSSPEKKQVKLTLPSRVWTTRVKGQIAKQQEPSQAADKLPSSASQPTEHSLEDFETSQVEYLLDAKEGIQACTLSTLNWSAPYDGLHPPPETLSPEITPVHERKRSSSTFDMSTNAPNSATFAVLAADEDTGLSSTYKSYSVAEYLPRPRDRKRSVDPKLTATIQEVLSLKIGTDCESVDTSDVNIIDLFMDEKNQSAVNGGSPENENKSSPKNVEFRPVENGVADHAEMKGSRNHTSEPQQSVDQKPFVENTPGSRPVANGHDGQTKPSGNLHTTEPNQSEDIVSELSTPESRVSSGKSRPRDLNVPCKHSQESDSAFSGSNSPVLDSNYNGGSSIPRVNPIGSSHKGSQVANWLQALGEDTDSVNFIDSLSDDQKRRKRLSLTRPEMERDSDEPCVFWEFDIEASPEAVSSKRASSGGDGIKNEVDQILHGLGFNVPRGANHKTNSNGGAYRNALNSEASEASTIETLNSSMNENHFSMLNSSFHWDRSLNASGFSNQSFNKSLRSHSSPVQGTAPRSMYTPVGRTIGMPTTGPFMDAIFARLDTMMQNSFYVNLLLTGIVARLAYYPQPLIRSYLLNTSMVFQPSVRSLIQVLTTIRNNLDAYAATIPEFENLLVRAKEYLFMREDGDSVYKGRSLNESEGLDKTTRQRSGSLKSSVTRKSNALDLFLRRGSRRNKSISAAEKQKLSRINEAGMALPAASAEYQSLKTRNAVYCAVILDEFLKELAAISQEHAVAFSELELGLR
ncbi:FTS and Hook-interacting protein-like isoform X1 [Asterias rubens]|uniref:FTS and Hook-interacting protein-like isoform X1 n=1 Tax=Asterias rubens TaxID=7604 RepID=UPI0014552FDB|nr:FTS and Hook-interacting protein-like isoform X1 [Asterias rubens]